MNSGQFAALIGFLFVGAWASMDFGIAILCLIGAAIFYVAMAFYRGELDVAALQQRASQASSSSRFTRSN